MAVVALQNFWHKLRHWEYWPWYIVYLPIFAYWLWCGLKARALFYMSAANPGFAYGGILGASKKDILDKLPAELVPTTILQSPPHELPRTLRAMQAAGLNFPVIAKPDVGERGFRVSLLYNSTDLEHYLQQTTDTIILQEYIDLPLEVGVFYYRLPGDETGQVSSVVVKGLLKVTGDGHHSVAQLMQGNPRARLQLRRLQKKNDQRLDAVPQPGEEVLLEPIGNHVRGTTFLDGTHLINEQLHRTFNHLAHQIDGFYYGRFDLRCANVEALYKGNFKILELNGAASEPAHIYAPGFTLLRAYGVLFRHWRTLYQISRANHRQGVPYMSWRMGLEAIRRSRFLR